MGVGSGKSMHNAELIQLDRHLKKTAPLLANCAYLKLACVAGKHYSTGVAGFGVRIE
jgi:hypothetical protein